MNVLVIGGGGREHALAWKLAQSPRVAQVFVAPGNAGTAREDGLTNVPLTDIAALVAFARRETIALTVVGPGGAAGRGHRRCVPRRGPAHLRPDARGRAARELEGFRQGVHGAPRHPDRRVAHVHRCRGRRTRTSTRAARRSWSRPTASPPARAWSSRRPRDEAHAAIDMMLVGNALGDAGARVVIEEFLEGEEASFIVMVDGTNVLPLASSQDHKRLCDGDQGPNTGGMGAYSPAPVVTPQVHARIMREIDHADGAGHGRRRHAVHAASCTPA